MTEWLLEPYCMPKWLALLLIFGWTFTWGLWGSAWQRIRTLKEVNRMQERLLGWSCAICGLPGHEHRGDERHVFTRRTGGGT